MKPRKETFRKSERLCSRKTITLLFNEGDVFYTPLFKIVWTINPEETQFPALVAVSVLKKTFRRAVDRNLLKRRIREAYRHKKAEFYELLISLNTRIAFIIIFRGNQIPEYPEIEKSMSEMMEKLIKTIRDHRKNC